MKLLINREIYGEYRLSELMEEMLGEEVHSMSRNDPALVETAEAVGLDRAAGPFCTLAVVEVPDGAGWRIVDDDGEERVLEYHMVP